MTPFESYGEHVHGCDECKAKPMDPCEVGSALLLAAIEAVGTSPHGMRGLMCVSLTLFLEHLGADK